MSTSRDYRTPLFLINGELLADGSVPPSKLQSGIPGSLLQNGSVPPTKLQSIPGSLLLNGSVPPAKLQPGISGTLLQDDSVPPAKLQSGIPGELLQNESVPLAALAPDVASGLRLEHSAPFATYPDSSRGIYRLVNAYRALTTLTNDILLDNLLVVVPVIPDRGFSLGTAFVVCSSVATAGPLNIGLYNSGGSLLSSASRTINSTGLLSVTFNPTVNLQARQVYYLAFLKTSGSYYLTSVNYLAMEYAYYSAPNLFLTGAMRFSATSLPTSLSGLTLAEVTPRVPALLVG